MDIAKSMRGARRRLLHSALALAAATGSAASAAATCPTLPAQSKAFVAAALDLIAEGTSKGRTPFTVFECAYRAAMEVAGPRFREFYDADRGESLRLLREAADQQKKAEDLARQKGDPVTAENFYGYQLTLREHAIERLSTLEPPPATELVRHYSYALASLAENGDGIRARELAAGADAAVLDAESKFIYLKAVASCPKWDMSSAENIDSSILAQRLRTPACAEAAEEALPTVCEGSAKAKLPRLKVLLGKFHRAGKGCGS